MKILLIADGRSATTRSCVKTITALGHQVVLVSTYPCAPVDGVEAEVILPVAFSSLGGSGSGNLSSGSNRQPAARRIIARARPVFMAARYLLGPLTLRYYGPRLRWLIERIQPDIVHALRIPFEGMLASSTPKGIPLIVSIWGNDLTLHASGSSRMAALTRRTLERADALLADTQRDIRLARGWGLDDTKPALVVPGNGGLDLDDMNRIRNRVGTGGSLYPAPFPEDTPLVINPRGFRTGSVRQDTFFEALPIVLKERPDARFACMAMAGQAEAQKWVRSLKLENNVLLMPHLPQDHLWELFVRAQVSVTVSQHDGTPNTLLEAMALGTFPVAGDIESLREWITPGVNGLLVEPGNAPELAEAICLSLENTSLRASAAVKNAMLVSERAEAGMVQEKIGLLYEAMSASREIPEEV